LVQQKGKICSRRYLIECGLKACLGFSCADFFEVAAFFKNSHSAVYVGVFRVFQTFLGLDFFKRFIDCLRAFEGEDVEDCKIKPSLSALEN